MPKNYLELDYTEVRRRDRAIEDEEWIRSMLHQVAIGTLSTVYNGQPFINSNLYVYDEATNCIYMHTAKYGRTRANLEQDERVCFSVTEMGRLLPADTALEFSVEYASVVVFGSGSLISEREEAAEALQKLLDKYAPHLRPGRDYRPITDEELARTAVYRIAIEQWSGKRKKVDDDFPSAYLYPYSAD